MPLNPQDFYLKPAMVDRCDQLLEQWDARDPRHPTSADLGKRLLSLVYEACEPAVPLLASPEAAARFLRPIVAFHRLVEDEPDEMV